MVRKKAKNKQDKQKFNSWKKQFNNHKNLNGLNLPAKRPIL